MREKYTVIIVQAYESETPQGQLTDNCTIELITTDPEVALAKAKKLVSKKHYRVGSIIERFHDAKS